jgi:hypothetical protein
MNRLPEKKKRGDPILAEDWNTLLDAIAARTPRPGTGLELIASSGGFAYSHPGGLFIPRQSLPPFSVIGIEKGASSYQVIIKEGWVIERKPKSEDVPTVKFHMPKSGEDRLDMIPRPKIAMNLGDTLWCKYQTDTMGEVSGEPEVIVASNDQDGSHYQPQDPEESGQEGTYYVQLFKLEDADGSPRVKVFQQSDIEHWAVLWTGENLGGGSRVYKKHLDSANKFQFRSLLGVDGIRAGEVGDEIHIGGDGAHLNLEIYVLQYDNDGHIYGSASLESTLYFRKGIYMGDADPDDGNPPEGLVTYKVHRLVNAA